MVSVAKGLPSLSVMPEIELADALDGDPQRVALQTKRIEEITQLLPDGNVDRGRKIFNNVAKSLCLTCHVMGSQGVKFGPDLTGIGSIRSKQDLLEAILYPSSSIARYYERVLVKTKKGDQADYPLLLMMRLSSLTLLECNKVCPLKKLNRQNIQTYH